MSNWMPINRKDFDLRRKRQINNVELNVIISPYDVPEGVRGAFDDVLGRFVIEFSYIGDEPWRRESPDRHLTLRVGKKSNRLYGIEVDVHALKAESVVLRLGVPKLVSSALTRLSSREQSRSDNYDLAREVIRRRESELFAQLS